MSCLPPKGKCEWFELRHFVKHYNEYYGKAYELEKCLDVEDSTRPQPEVLVRCDGCLCMVIERKSVVWPPDYAKDHNKDHALMSALSETLNPIFQDGAYALELVGAEISTKDASQMAHIAKQIAGEILSARKSGTLGRVSGTQPIRWAFGINEECESRRGVTIVVTSQRNLFDFDHRQRSLEGGALELSTQLEKAARKFAGYESCIKTVLVQFYGEDFSTEQVEQMISRIKVPGSVDQIWLTYSEPISDDEYEMKYDRVYP